MTTDRSTLETEEMRRPMDDAEQDFLERMSHELRTPLNAIRGYAELLLEGKPQGHPDRGDLEAIHRATLRMTALVDAVLDLGQLQRGRFDVRVEPVDLRAQIAELIEAVRDRATTDGTEIRARISNLTVTVDRRMTRQILFNLLDNACRFCPGGTVRVTAAALDDERFELAVEDDGVGMTPAQIRAATEPFWQGDRSSTRRYGGAGMGLAVCRGMAEAMGGSLAIQSRPGRGARVTVTLPREVRVSAVDRTWSDDEPTVLLR